MAARASPFLIGPKGPGLSIIVTGIREGMGGGGKNPEKRGRIAGMKLRCNLNSRGKAFRLRMGTLIVIGGVVAVWLWTPAGGWVAWAVSVVALVGGAFMIFEGRTGWCALRAMGMRTRI